MNVPSFSGSNVIVTCSSTPPTVTCPPPKDLTGGFGVGRSPPPPLPKPPPPIVESPLGLGNGAFEFPSYEPQTPAAGGDATLSDGCPEFPLLSSVDAVVNELVVLTGPWTPLLIALDAPFVFGGLES